MERRRMTFRPDAGCVPVRSSGRGRRYAAPWPASIRRRLRSFRPQSVSDSQRILPVHGKFGFTTIRHGNQRRTSCNSASHASAALTRIAVAIIPARTLNRLVDLKYKYEEGDTSPWNVLIKIDKETELRNYLANELTETAHARYSITQEEEMPNAQRTDFRFKWAKIPGMVPVELKIADKWSGPQLFAKLKDQLCGDYMRDVDSTSGIYLLVHHGKKIKWQHPASKNFLPFEELIAALQCSAQNIIASCPGISNIEVIGIDLIKRSKSMQK